jgi:hypothetical protein
LPLRKGGVRRDWWQPVPGLEGDRLSRTLYQDDKDCGLPAIHDR